MEHGGMEHGGTGHEGHGGMGGGMHHPSCAMNMVWNTSPANVCLVFPFLQVGTSAGSILGHCLFIASLAALYEYTRLHLPRLDRQLRIQLKYGYGPAANPLPPLPPSASRRPSAFGPVIGIGVPQPDTEALLASPIGAGDNRSGAKSPKLAGLGSRLTAAAGAQGVALLPWTVQTRRSLIYVANVALSFYLMLIVMTYNAQLIASILLGAFLGHLVCHRALDITHGTADEDGEGAKGASCH